MTIGMQAWPSWRMVAVSELYIAPCSLKKMCFRAGMMPTSNATMAARSGGLNISRARCHPLTAIRVILRRRGDE
jgi:hypothetical protein